MKKVPFQFVNTGTFSKQIAKEFGVSQKQARKVLMIATTNLCKMIERGEEIKIKRFGRIYFLKEKKNG